jgi:hypothetical protein
VLQLPSAAIPIPAVVLVAFNLAQDRVDSGSGRVRLVFMHDLMGGMLLTSQSNVDGLKKLILHSQSNY